jgi:hypothetical protein
MMARPRGFPWGIVSVAVALAAAGQAGPAARGEDVALRWAFKPGQTLRYEFRQKNEVTIKADGQETRSTSALTIAMTWSVKSVTDGAADLGMVVDRVRVEIQNGPSKILYDSLNADAAPDPAAKPLHDVYRAVVGADYRLRLDARGRVVEAKVPEKVAQAVRGSPFVGVADGGSVLSEEGIKNLLAQVVPPLPEKPAGPGAKWDAAFELPTAPLAMTLTFRYSLDALDATSAVIKAAVTSAITPEPGAPFGVTIKDQSGSARYTFDRKGGRLAGAEVNQTITLALGFMGREIGQSIVVSERFAPTP